MSLLTTMCINDMLLHYIILKTLLDHN